jgi:hypothetical protein
MDGRLAKRPRGAYYAALNTSQTLRKRRPKVRPSLLSSVLDPITDGWHSEEKIPRFSLRT